MARKFLDDPRDRTRPLKVFVNIEERAIIEQKAEVTGLSVSAYLRTVATGQEVKSVHDLEATLALLKAMADLGRLGGLLKLWLASKPGEAASTAEVRRVLHEIEASQTKLRVLIDRL